MEQSAKMTSELELRPAARSDARILFEWRNDEETRQHSRDKKPLDFAAHEKWLSDSLKNPSRKIFIAYAEGAPVGVVRGDTADGCVELSWTVAPAFRGHGIGKRMVLQFVRDVAQDAPLKAFIRDGNSASEKIAQALGLHPLRGDSEESGEHAMVEWRSRP